jgi:hypothetical protein
VYPYQALPVRDVSFPFLREIGRISPRSKYYRAVIYNTIWSTAMNLFSRSYGRMWKKGRRGDHSSKVGTSRKERVSLSALNILGSQVEYLSDPDQAQQI